MENKQTIAFVHGEFPCGGAEKVTLEISEFLSGEGFNIIVLCRQFRRELMPENHPIKVVTYKHKLKKKESALEFADLIRFYGIKILTYVCIHPLQATLIRQLTGVFIISANHGMPFWQAIGKNISKEGLSRGNLWQRLRWYIYYRFRCHVLHLYDKRCHAEYKRVLTDIDYYTVLCDSYRDELCKVLQLNETEYKKIRVIPNYQTPVDNPIKKKQRVVLYVGRLTYSDKRVDRLLDIWKQIEPNFPDWRLLIVGDGEEKGRLKKQARHLHLQNISFEGWQTNMQPYYDQAAILALVSSIEGWGLVLSEAQANGVVPIAFNCSAGVSTLLSPSGTNGILVPPFNIEAFVNELSRLMRDDNWRLSLSHNVLLKKYPRQEVCQLYLKFYTEILACHNDIKTY